MTMPEVAVISTCNSIILSGDDFDAQQVFDLLYTLQSLCLGAHMHEECSTALTKDASDMKGKGKPQSESRHTAFRHCIESLRTCLSCSDHEMQQTLDLRHYLNWQLQQRLMHRLQMQRQQQMPLNCHGSCGSHGSSSERASSGQKPCC